MGLGLWGNEEQSGKPLAVPHIKIKQETGKDYNCSPSDTEIIGWFDIPENHPDRILGDITYIQGVEVKYPISGWGEAHACYGITDDGKVHIFCD